MGIKQAHTAIWYALVLAPDREFCESKVRGKYKKPPHLLVVRAGNSRDPGPVWLRQEAKRRAQWLRRRPDRGGDRAAAAATLGVFLNTARSDGIEYQKRAEEMNESRQTVAARKPVRRGGGGRRSRMLRRSVRDSAAAATGVQDNTKPTRPGKEL